MNVVKQIVAGLVVFGLLACGNQSNADAEVPEQDYRQRVSLLTWRYLPQDADLIAKFENRFQAKVNVQVMPMGEIVRRAQADNLPTIDLILVPSLEDAVRLREMDALQPFFANSFTNGDVDDRFIDNEGYYSGLTRWTMTAVYNPNAVTAEEASTYGNLAKLPLRGIRVGIAHPDSSGIPGVVAGLAGRVSQEAASVWARLMYERSTGGMRGSDYDQLDRMLAGELDVALVSVGAANRWFLNGNPVHYEAAETWRARFPKTDNEGLNFMNMTCITMAKDAPNRNLALLLIDFLYEKEQQEALGSSWFEFPGQTFTPPNEFLIGYPDPIGRKVSAEELDGNIPLAWSIINQIAAENQQ